MSSIQGRQLSANQTTTHGLHMDRRAHGDPNRPNCLHPPRIHPRAHMSVSWRKEQRREPAGPTGVRLRDPAKYRLARGTRRHHTETPLRLRAGRPLGRNSASLEGRMPPRARLRLARGPDAPSGETPPRSRAGCPLGRNSALLEARTPPRAELRLARGQYGSTTTGPRRHTHSPDQSIKCSGALRTPGSRANPRHAGPLIPPRNPTPALFRQTPVLCGHPRHCTVLCGKASVNSVTLCRLLPYGGVPHSRKRMVEPSKKVRTLLPRPRRTAP
jgi:hypothetical protein